MSCSAECGCVLQLVCTAEGPLPAHLQGKFLQSGPRPASSSVVSASSMAAALTKARRAYTVADRSVSVSEHQQILEEWFTRRGNRDIWSMLSMCRNMVT